MSLFLKVKKKGQDDSEARTMTRKSFEAGASRRGWVIVSEIVNEKPKSQVQELMAQKIAERAAKETGPASEPETRKPGRPKKEVEPQTPVENEA
jgi:hypothetical protein